MSKTWHSKKARAAGIEGHHQHGPDDTCRFCGKAKKGGPKKRDRAAVLEAMARATRPHHVLALLEDMGGYDALVKELEESK